MDTKKPTFTPKNTKKPTNFDVAPSATPSADSILRELHAAGIRLEMNGDVLSASPANHLTEKLRSLIRDHKPALMEYLAAVQKTTADLVEFAMQACERHGDGPEAREQMRRDCMNTPPHLRADLRDHFRQTYQAEANRKPKGAL